MRSKSIFAFKSLYWGMFCQFWFWSNGGSTVRCRIESKHISASGRTTSRFVRFRWCRDGEAGPIPPSLRRGSNRDLAGRQEPIGLIAGNHGYDSIVFQSYRRSKDQMGTAPALIVLAIRARWVSESQVELSPGGRESCHFIQIPNDTWG